MSTEATAPDRSLSAHVSEEIRALMGRRDINKTELARRLGVSDMWVGRRLRGQAPIGLNDLQRIAVVLGVSVTDLFPREEGRRLPSSPLGERVVATVGEQRRKTSTSLLPAPRPHRPGRAVRQTRPLGRVPEMTVR